MSFKCNPDKVQISKNVIISIINLKIAIKYGWFDPWKQKKSISTDIGLSLEGISFTEWQSLRSIFSQTFIYTVHQKKWEILKKL